MLSYLGFLTLRVLLALQRKGTPGEDGSTRPVDLRPQCLVLKRGGGRDVGRRWVGNRTYRLNLPILNKLS